MKFSWLVFAWIVLANTLYIGVMYVAQLLDKNLLPRHSIIKGTNQKFLYMQDFYTMYGDLFGVPLIVNAFVHLIVRNTVNLWWGVIFGVVSAMTFSVVCLGKGHKPDQGFPEIGKISLNGILHLPYFGTGIGASVMCLWNLFTGNLVGPVMWITIIGGVFYIVCFIAGMKSGNFDSLKKIEVQSEKISSN